MKILPVLLVFTALPALAQNPATPAASPDSGSTLREAKQRVARATPPPRTARPSATPLPIRRAVRVNAAEETRKPGFFSRIFGGGKAKPAAATAAAPTPTPPQAARKAPPKAPTVATSAPSSPQPALPEPNEAANRPLPTPKASRPSASVKITPPAHEEEPAVSIPRGVEEVAPGDETPYQRVRREAARDSQVAALGEKLNAADPGDAYKAAARSYATALFAKMREIDPAQSDWFNRMESATMRRIDAGKPFVAE